MFSTSHFKDIDFHVNVTVQMTVFKKRLSCFQTVLSQILQKLSKWPCKCSGPACTGNIVQYLYMIPSCCMGNISWIIAALSSLYILP